MKAACGCPASSIGPGHVPADKQLDGMVHVVDLYPTLLKLAGGSLEQPLPLDGVDMWEVFTGAKAITTH